ncbi:hypothetical protein [Streptomyces carpaticus]|uniref:Uncharacterized protein n=1 Tax=Streptomyces carpaticus TaxID=285558 RepID=A0ABV4ZJS6_9ACTN
MADFRVHHVTRNAQRKAVYAVALAACVLLLFYWSIPFGFGPLLVGVAVVAGGLYARRSGGSAISRAVLLTGGLMMLFGAALLAGMGTGATSSSTGGDDSVPREAPVLRPPAP